MIPLLTPHPTLSALYKAIVANPTADDPRLQFADACEEIDDPHPSIPAWGEFIKAQYALKAIGEPRFVIESISVETPGGPGYYRVSGAFDDPIKVGDRVDLNGGILTGRGAPKVTTVRQHGLVVTRIVPTDSHGATEIILKRDAESVPFPAKERQRLKDDCRYLFGNHGADWMERYGKHTAWKLQVLSQSWLVPVGTAGFAYDLILERGFVSEVQCFWGQWLKEAKHILPRFPITKVHLTDAPIYSGRAHVEKDGSCGTFWFTPKGPRVTDLMVSLDAMEPNVSRDRIRRALLAKHWPSVAEWELPPVAPTRWFGYDTSDLAGPETP